MCWNAGQGTQWPQMGLDLVRRFSVCKDTMTELDAYIKALDERPSWTLEGKFARFQDHTKCYPNVRPEKITTHSQDVDRAEIAQPLITCIQIMIINLLRSWKIEPRACLGHSSGKQI